MAWNSYNISVDWTKSAKDLITILFAVHSPNVTTERQVRKSRNVKSDSGSFSYSPWHFISSILHVFAFVSLQSKCLWFVEQDICVTGVMRAGAKDWLKAMLWNTTVCSQLPSATPLPSATLWRPPTVFCMPGLWASCRWFSYLMAWLAVS